ncbi:MAG: hypothetical protein SF053_10955 [Bacteroidia bacterium]|nr:hypothetical protein [Bacteroidia bacterium]
MKKTTNKPWIVVGLILVLAGCAILAQLLSAPAPAATPVPDMTRAISARP